MKKNNIVMIGTDLDTKGGIASVVKVYQAAGLFDRFGIDYLATHCDGGALAKLRIMASAYGRFLTRLARGRIGLVHIHVASRASFWRKSGFFLLAALCRVPAILHLHGAEFAQFYGEECGPIRRRLVRHIFDRATRVVVLSDAWRDWARGMSRNPRIDAIYNPVMLPATVGAWAGREAGAVLSLGRIGKRKGSYDLLAAVARIAPRVAGVRVLLGGDGELDGARARAAELGVGDRLALLGWVGGDDKEDYLARATVYTLPSYNEGLPMSVLEAMAAGLPIVSTPVGGIPEAVSDGVEGYLVAPGDVAALAARLEQLLTDAPLARRMGEAARRKVETTFSSAAVLPRVEQLYLELGCEPV